MMMVAFDVLLHAGYESGLLVALKEGHNALDGRWRNNVVRVFQRQAFLMDSIRTLVWVLSFSLIVWIK